MAGKNIAMIMAGGVGARMKAKIPKQFIVVNNKPILIYTLEVFEKSPSIDEIVVVLHKDWFDITQRYIADYKFKKVKHLVLGGDLGFESIQNGVRFLSENYEGEDIVLIHDAVRPLVNDNIINSNIAGVIENGNAITYIPSTEALLFSDNGEYSEKIVDRDTILRTQTPQSLYLKDLVALHKEAVKKKITNSVATCTLLIELGHKVFPVLGDNSNFKITSPEDIALLKAYLDQNEKN